MNVAAEEPNLTGPPGRLRAFGPRAASVTVSSHLPAARSAVWDRVTTAAGINDEMRPIIRMTLPGGIDSLGQVPVGEPIGKSWVLLGGLVPFDYDDLMIAHLDEGTGFVERSTMGSQRLWEHVRMLADDDPGCRLTDRLTWEPRLGLPGRPLTPLIRRFFRHRHSRLQRHFGATLPTAPSIS